jgi:hypothetical protein
VPDASKLAKLREIGMRFVETCATCAHGVVPDLWGSCRRASYTHGKHTEPLDMPAHLLMVCTDYKRCDARVEQLAGGLSGVVPVVGTDPLRWVTCPGCGWSGWHTRLTTHVMNAGDHVSATEHCPRCNNVVEKG